MSIRLSTDVYPPIAAKVIVKQGQQATFSVKLGVDPLVSKELSEMEVYPGPDEP